MTFPGISLIVVMSALTWMLAVWFVERRFTAIEKRLTDLEARTSQKLGR